MTLFVEALTGIAESIMIYMLYGALYEKRETINNWIYFIFYALFALVSDISFWFLGGTLFNIIILYSTSVGLSFLYKCDIKARIATPLFVFTINILIEMIVWYLTNLTFNISAIEQANTPNIWILGAILSKTILLIVINFVRLRLKNRKLFENRIYWLLFIVVFLPTALIDYLLFRLTLTITEPIVSILAIIGSLGLIISSFVVLFLYERFAIQAESANREQQYEQQLKSQSKHLDEILVMQNQLKGFRHDIKNHWVALSGYFSNGDCEGGKRYIEQISGTLNDNETTDTGNIALDAILSTKKALAEEKGIQFEATIQIPEQIPVDAADICIIFGNSLDNAIEACEKIKSDKKYIKLSVIYEDNTILCKVVNTVESKHKITLKTTKKDKSNHGFGFDNIKQSLSKYNHLMKIDQNDNEFILSFVIFTS